MIQNEPIMIHLPDTLYHRLQQAAQTTNIPLEELLLQTIAGNMPPTVDDTPEHMQDQLQALQVLDNSELWEVARSRISPKQQVRYEELLHRNQRGEITPEELTQLADLGERADELTLKKAYAYALLRWRGFPLPTLESLESSVGRRSA